MTTWIIAIPLLFSLSVEGRCQDEGFELTYTVQGRGMLNLSRTFYPIININGDQFSYTIEEGTYTLPFRQTSKDSIFAGQYDRSGHIGNCQYSQHLSSSFRKDPAFTKGSAQ